MRDLILRLRTVLGTALLAVAGLTPWAAGQAIIGVDPSIPATGSVEFDTQPVGPDTPRGFPLFSNGMDGRNLDQIETIGGPASNAFPLLGPNTVVLASGAGPLGGPPFASGPAAGGLFGGGAVGEALFTPPAIAGSPPPVGLAFFTVPAPASPFVTDGPVDGIASTAYGHMAAHFTTTGGAGIFLTAASYLMMTPPGGVSQLSLNSTINPTTIGPGGPSEGALLRDAQIVGGDDMNPGHPPGALFKAFSAGSQVTIANTAGGTLGSATTMTSGLVSIGISNLPTEYQLQSWLTVSVDPGAQVRPSPFTDDQILAMYPGSSSATAFLGMDPTTTYHWTNAAYLVPGEDGNWAYKDGMGKAIQWNYLAQAAPEIPNSGLDVYFDNTGIMNSTTPGVGHVKFEIAAARSLLFIQSAGPYMIDGNSAAFKGPLFVGTASGGSIESWTAQPVTFNAGVNIKAQFDLVLRTADPSGVMTFNCPITPQTAGMPLTVETDGLGRTILNDTTSQITLLRIRNGTTEAVPGAVPSKVDIAGGALEIRYGAAASPDAMIRTKLIATYAGGTWAGNSQFGSSTAAANPRQFALGYADGADGLAANLPAGFERIMLTHPGDANLDGKVDFPDLLIVAQHYGLTSGARWDEGDFNYDGAVGFDDLLLLAQNYAAAVDPPGPAEGTPVPEPASTVLMVLAGAGLFAARRR